MSEEIKKKGRPKKVQEASVPKPKGARGPRPHVWKCGPDPKLHVMYDPWLKAKAQSDYRNRQGLETGAFKLSFDDWATLWKDEWINRGRDPDSMCMTRKDFKKAWTIDNCEIVTRLEHLQRQGAMARGKPRKRRKNTNV